MHLAERTPVLPGESLTSWVGRLARREAGIAPFGFLNFLQLNRKEVIEATLALIRGEPPELATSIPLREPGWLVFAPEEPVDLEADRFRQHLEEGTTSGDELAQLYFAF